MKFDMAGVSVCIVMPINRDMSIDTTLSLLRTQDAMQKRGIPLGYSFIEGGSIVEAARSQCVHSFLKTDYTRIFWIDSDIGWKPEDFIKLVALSTKMEVVGAVYPAKKDPPEIAFNVDTFIDYELNEYGCFSIKGFGLGFTIMQRHVIEELAAKAPKLVFPSSPEPVAHLFRCDAINGLFRGEDMAFFADIRDLGYQVHFDPSIVLSHIGSKAYSTAPMEHLIRVDEPIPAAA